MSVHWIPINVMQTLNAPTLKDPIAALVNLDTQEMDITVQVISWENVLNLNLLINCNCYK